MQKPEVTIQFIKEYLADPSSKSFEQVYSNASEAFNTFISSESSVVAKVAYDASAAIKWESLDVAARWVEKFEELTK